MTTATAPPLEQALADLTREGELYRRLADGRIQCDACGHRCRLGEGEAGICRVRFHTGGRLQVPAGYVGHMLTSPVEQQPFLHALPGATVFGFSMLGCNYHCGYCHNWTLSQTLRDPDAGEGPRRMMPQELVRLARRAGASIIASKYNEPLITAEWAAEIFAIARAQGLLTAFTSNGHATPEALAYLRPVVDLYKVDLKAFREESYRSLGGSLRIVLRSIEQLMELGFWVEVVTLCVPGFNDSDQELKEMAAWLASLSRDLPWHVIAFHQDYRMRDRPDTPDATLMRAVAIGRAAGLRYVYAGNRPALEPTYQNTSCPGCGAVLVERSGFRCIQSHLVDGSCPGCATPIPGIWPTASGPLQRNLLAH